MKGDYRNLKTWQKAMTLCYEVYSFLTLLPNEERFAIADQLRRAAVSIPSNIAEGHGRQSEKEFVQFLYIARGSVFEVETQIIICRDIYSLNNEKVIHILDLINQLKRMLGSLIAALKS